MQHKQITYKEALIKAQNLCARQEKCRSDIRKKLYDWQTNHNDIEKIIDRLLEDNFIDELRFAEFYVRDKFRFNKWGRIKISFLLKEKLIPDDIISKALQQISEDEYREILKKELLKKKKSIKDKDIYKIKEKLLRFAQSRGFELALILEIIDNIEI